MVLAVALTVPCCAWATPVPQEIRKCLDGFAGITWQLPYAPVVRVHNCSSASGAFNAQYREGDAVIELISSVDFDLIHEYRDEQDAFYAHFDSLFRANGYSAGAVQYSYSNQGSYVSSASWVQHDKLEQRELRMEKPFQNVWRITLRIRPKLK